MGVLGILGGNVEDLASSVGKVCFVRCICEERIRRIRKGFRRSLPQYLSVVRRMNSKIGLPLPASPREFSLFSRWYVNFATGRYPDSQYIL